MKHYKATLRKIFSYLITGTVVLTGVFLFVANTAHAAETLQQLGSDNAYSAGAIQTVQPGYGLTAIGYGSDDWKCIVGIKTAPVNADGSVDFSQTDTSFQNTPCASGVPGDDHAGNQKSFEPIANSVVTGWSWGADTSGGYPDTDSEPADECYYQEYMNLQTKQNFGFGQPNTGTCGDRGYQLSDLKQVARAPSGRVIVGILFNLDMDASLDFLAETTREIAVAVIPAGTLSSSGSNVSNNAIQVCSGTLGTATITATANVDWQVHVGSPTGQLFMSGGANNSASSVAPWITAGMVFYLTNASDGSVLNTLTMTFTTAGCPAPPPPPPTTCSLSANTATTITTGQGVVWAINSNPSGLHYFWNVTGPVPQNHIAGEGTGLTPFTTSSYVVNTPGTYQVSFVVENPVGTPVCTSNTVTVQVNPPPPPPPPTTCSLSANTTAITVGQSVTWTISSNPSGLPYFWYVTGPTAATSQTHVAGEGTGLTPFSKSYAVNTAGSYQTKFVLEDGHGDVICTSNIVTTSVSSPSGNQPPTITLNGANPYNLTRGNPFNDPGATAMDPEDGNITSRIVETGSVNPSAVGTYTLTYSVTDSGGLSASVTRDVIVSQGACGLSSNTTTIFVNSSVTWTATSSPSGLAYFWYTTGPTTASNQNHVAGEGTGLTDWTGTYNYGTSGTYTAYFVVENPIGTVICTSNRVNLTVNPSVPVTPSPSFDFSLSNEGDKSVVAGNSVTNNITASLVSGTTQGVSFTASGLPTGATPSFSVGSCSPTCSSTLTITTNSATPAGTYPITVTATGGGLTKTTTFNLTVSAFVAPPAGGGGGGTPTGQITFCLMLADSNNVIATTSAALPAGTFSINLTGSASFATTTAWATNVFSPNKKIILGVNDAHCFTYTNLPFGTYNYSQLSIAGPALWLVPQYDDQENMAINNVFDFFPYGTNVNSDGAITLNASQNNRTLVVLEKDNLALSCLAPQITSSLSLALTNGQAVGYQLTASSTTPVVFSVSNLPPGLLFSTTTNAITGIPQVTGTFLITLNAFNTCASGLDTKTLTLVVNQNGGGGGGPVSAGGGATSSGGGGGGGGNGPIQPNYLTITNEQVVETVPNIGFVTWNTNLPATRRVVYDTMSHSVLDNSSTNYGYGKSTELVDSPLLTAHGMVVGLNPNTTYYFRAISTAMVNGVMQTAVSKELVLNRGQVVTTPIAQAAGCYYLFDYLRKGYNNDPIEVKKLQVFLRDLQGYTNVQVTGVFDDATDAAVRLFQMKYASDILVPWGYGPNEPTGYVYILTKKKINEIYCGMAFPVTPQQQAEITAFRNFLLGLHNAGITYPVSAPTNVPEATSTPLENNVIGEATPSPTTTPGLLANILSAFGLSNSCPSGFCGWLNLLLLLIIIIISSLWYREYRNKKKLEEINKDLSLKQ